MFAHCDVNAFYASCQTAFRPDLKGRPVVVLSNNDGCVIARSADYVELKVKALLPVSNIFYQSRNIWISVFCH
ncbi:DNA polymerase V subunit UmuC, partial [Klebsiella pneumoniae]|nr:DNA polymerase V subunit UmuC [Klebsiella pneumoniae]